MTAKSNAAIVRRSWERYAARDVSGSRACFADNFVAHVAGYPDEISMAEYSNQGRMWLQAFPDFSITFETEVSEGNLVTMRLVIRGTHQGSLMGIPATGKHVELSGVTIDRVVDGLIVERWAYWDLLGLMQQLRLMPPLTFTETPLGRASLWLATRPKKAGALLASGIAALLAVRTAAGGD